MSEGKTHPIVADIERCRREQQLAGAIMLGELMVKIITSKPPERMHWWQFWRPKP